MYTPPEKIARFKRGYRHGNSEDRTESRWHIAASPYKKGGFYKEYRALCGYTVKHPYLTGAVLSIAKMPKGQHCSKCVKKAAMA